MFGNSRSLIAWSGCHFRCSRYVCVKTRRNSHTQDIDVCVKTMEEVVSVIGRTEFLTVLCMDALHIYSKSSMV